MNIEIKDAYALIDGKIERHSIYIEGDSISDIDAAPKGVHATNTIDAYDIPRIPDMRKPPTNP